MEIGCVILASGEGVRFGGNKLLSQFGGRPVLQWLLDALPQGLRAMVVTRSPEIAALAKASRVPALLHALPDVSDTIRLGAERMLGTAGCLFCVGDQPLLTRGTLERILATFQADPTRIVRAAFAGRMGNPVLFPAALYPELTALSTGQTGGVVLKRHPELLTPVQATFAEELDDIDTPDALRQLEAVLRARIKEASSCC